MMANAKSMINERKTQLSAMMPAPPPKPSLVFIREREREKKHGFSWFLDLLDVF